MSADVYVHGGNVYLESRLRGVPIEGLADFSANINPLGPSPRALEAISNNLGLISHYPDPDCTELCAELAGYLQVDPGLIVVGNGGTEVIRLVAEALRPGYCVVAAPTFSEYAAAVERIGGRVAYVPSGDIGTYLDRAEMVFMCNPNNPTGSIMPIDRVRAIARRAQSHGAVLVVDEAFIDFVDCPEAHTVRGDVEDNANLIVVGSLTKFFAIPGLRAGYAVAAEPIASRLRRARQSWSVNCLAQAAAAASLRDTNYIARTREYVAREREFLLSGLRELADAHGFRVWPPSANFIFISLPKAGLTASQVRERLATRGILVRDCSNFALLGQHSLRVAVRTRDENRRLLDALRSVL